MKQQQLRRSAVEFLISSCTQLDVVPIVKYTSLSLFSERFLPSLNNSCSKKIRVLEENHSWLLRPLRDCNLQIFALVAIWISSKIHDTNPLPVKSLKALGDEVIKEQHFTTRDFFEAEVVFMQVLDFEIGASKITYLFLEELLIQFRQVDLYIRQLARVGEHLNLEACIDIMDLLYETEQTSLLYRSPRALAAAVLVASYVITVPKLQWEFPLLPWVKFVTSYKEEDVGELVRSILHHVLMQIPEIRSISYSEASS